MLTDAHCHPFDLIHLFPEAAAEEEMKRMGVIAAVNACSLKDFSYNEKLVLNYDKNKIFPCFAVHPQSISIYEKKEIDSLLNYLNIIAKERRITAVGECGFDLFNDEFKKTEEIQKKVFIEHLETAIRYDLPVIIHARRAIHQIFAFSKMLSKCKAVIFHSWAGTLEEGSALLRRKVNAYFSFGNVILTGHKKAIRCIAEFPKDRILTETDAPYQPMHGKKFSSWNDLPLIIKEAASLRGENEEKMELQIEENFKSVFILPIIDFQ